MVRIPAALVLCAAGLSGFIPFDCACPRPQRKPTPGLSTGADARFYKDGQPIRAIGVNYFGCFARALADGTDTSYRQGFAELARRGIPFCRFMACPFWPAEYKLYLEDRPEYFRRLDGVVAAAEDAGIGLIPSLFWHSATVPDIVGEPRDQWGNPDSQTHAFLRTYVRELVTRYARSPAIWGWEFGNEYNLPADLPNAAKHRPPIVPRLGTPTSRSARDDLRHDHLEVTLAAFAREVRRHDPHRAIFTGNSVPRPSAWHQWKEGTWQQDTEQQYAQRLRRDNPDPVDTLTIHLYWDAQKRFGRQVTVKEFLRRTMAIAEEAGKPLFVGEFGAESTGQETRTRFERILAAIESSGVPLAALWVYDFPHQDGTWNITPDNPRSWQLDAIAAANRRLRR